MSWKIEEIGKLRGYTIEWAETNRYILSRRHQLFETDDLSSPLQKIAEIDQPFWKKSAAKFRLAQRLLRFMTTNVLPLENGDLFVTFDKSAGIVSSGKYLPLKGLHRPCRVLRGACAFGLDNQTIFFGEYLDNAERGEMRVYRYRQTANEIETAYVFPAQTIRHVHGIYSDTATNSLFCLTGDADRECRILKTTDDFQTVETVGAGDESWRAVSVLFTEKSFFYGTDAEFRVNRIYRVDRTSLQREDLGEVDGTIFYSKRIGEDLFFATTAENAPAQKENVASLWHVSADDGKLSKLATYHKDRWHGTFFMFGTIHFPNAPASNNELSYHLVGLDGDNRVFRVLKN